MLAKPFVHSTDVDTCIFMDHSRSRLVWIVFSRYDDDYKDPIVVDAVVIHV